VRPNLAELRLSAHCNSLLNSIALADWNSAIICCFHSNLHKSKHGQEWHCNMQQNCGCEEKVSE